MGLGWSGGYASECVSACEGGGGPRLVWRVWRRRSRAAMMTSAMASICSSVIGGSASTAAWIASRSVSVSAEGRGRRRPASRWVLASALVSACVSARLPAVAGAGGEMRRSVRRSLMVTALRWSGRANGHGLPGSRVLAGHARGGGGKGSSAAFRSAGSVPRSRSLPPGPCACWGWRRAGAVMDACPCR